MRPDRAGGRQAGVRMSEALLSGTLFLTPFLTGLAYAVLLPVLGCYLRLRDEWLAALAFTQVAAAGALVAMAIAAPPVLGGLAAAALAALVKHHSMRVGNAIYALLYLGGWGVAVLLVANLPLAERLARALFDGQLYFSGQAHLMAAWIALPLALAWLARLSRTLLVARFLPGHLLATGRLEGRFHFGFDLLIAGALALATMSIGVAAAFTLIFVPAWIVCDSVNGWRRALALSALMGAAGYAAAFLLALVIDQPFGPVLALTLALSAGLMLLLRRSAAPLT
ncbi:MAG: ABC transporter [Betaproteobacteria bacterium]|nr:ABC transporter [Betaproteobacteria bacterium]